MIYYDILKSFDYFDYANTNLIRDFQEWKYQMRQYSITAEVVNFLDGVPQGTFYHPEFDALLHTFLVLKAVVNMGREDLIEAAFLHDVGKAFTTNIGRNRIYHFGHAKKSMDFITKKKNHIKDWDLTSLIVKKHMDFNWKSKKLKQYPDIHDFMLADKITSKQLYTSANFLFFRNVRNKIKEKMLFLKQRFARQKIYIAIGIAGSGKSTYIRENFDPKIVVSPDEIRKDFFGDVNHQDNQFEVWAQTKLELLLTIIKYGKAVLDATNVNKWLRVEFMSNFNGIKKIALVFHADPDTSIRRIQEDINNKKDRSNVPENVVRKQFKLFKKGTKSIHNEFNKVVSFK